MVRAFTSGFEVARQARKRRLHRFQALAQRAVGRRQFCRGGDVLGQLGGHGFVEAWAPGQLCRCARDSLHQVRHLAAGIFRRFGDGLALLRRIGGEAIDCDQAVLLRQKKRDGIALLRPAFAQGVECGPRFKAGGRHLDALYFAAFGQIFQQFGKAVAGVAQFAEAILLSLHGIQGGLGYLLGQRRNVAGD